MAIRVEQVIDKVVARFIGTKHERDLKVIQPQVDRINGLAARFELLTDAELLEKTNELRAQVQAKLGNLPKRAGASWGCATSTCSSSAGSS